MNRYISGRCGLGPVRRLVSSLVPYTIDARVRVPTHKMCKMTQLMLSQMTIPLKIPYEYTDVYFFAYNKTKRAAMNITDFSTSKV